MAVKLNTKAVVFAESLIKQGRVNRTSDWNNNKPTSENGDAYLENHTHEDYGKWFLGIDPDTDPQTKEHYSFPIGNFKELFRSGIIAAEQRAGQYHHNDIREAARKLLNMIGE
jgi:hypothetical protein